MLAYMCISFSLYLILQLVMGILFSPFFIPALFTQNQQYLGYTKSKPITFLSADMYSSPPSPVLNQNRQQFGAQILMSGYPGALSWQNIVHSCAIISFINFIHLYLYPLPPPHPRCQKLRGTMNQKTEALPGAKVHSD